MTKLAPFARQNSIGYCTNVHAGTTMDSIRSRLSEFALPLAHKLPANQSLGVGLWLPKSAADELTSDADIQAFGDWLRANRLHAFTMNGFPYDNFHRPVVKHDVYVPIGPTSAVFDYTLRLAQILAALHSVSNADDSSPASTRSALCQWVGPPMRRMISRFWLKQESVCGSWRSHFSDWNKPAVCA